MEVNKNVLNLIVKCLESKQEEGCDIDYIIDYLDYYNKVAYTSEEINIYMDTLVQENKVKLFGSKWIKK